MAKGKPTIIDPETGIEIPEDWKTTKDMDVLGLETVAIHIAKCEGKDETNPTVLENIKKRIRIVEPTEI